MHSMHCAGDYVVRTRVIAEETCARTACGKIRLWMRKKISYLGAHDGTDEGDHNDVVPNSQILVYQMSNLLNYSQEVSVRI
jgi:hypothetical protein